LIDFPPNPIGYDSIPYHRVVKIVLEPGTGLSLGGLCQKGVLRVDKIKPFIPTVFPYRIHDAGLATPDSLHRVSVRQNEYDWTHVPAGGAGCETIE
jgi:hypothetical protein